MQQAIDRVEQEKLKVSGYYVSGLCTECHCQFQSVHVCLFSITFPREYHYFQRLLLRMLHSQLPATTHRISVF